MNQRLFLIHRRPPRWVALALTAWTVTACDPALDEDTQEAETFDVLAAELGGQPSHAKWLAANGKTVFDVGLVPAAAANLPDGKVLLWAANKQDNFNDAPNEPKGGSTLTAIFDPTTPAQVVTVARTNTRHDMFCPGTTNLADGRILVNGGKNEPYTSIYDPAHNSWINGGDMAIGRGYQGNTLLADGSVLTLGGSWSGDAAQTKDAELWSNGVWRRLPNLVLDSSFDAKGINAKYLDNHMWLFPMSNGRILHAGPSVQMHWLDAAGDGSVQPIGPRGDDKSSLNGSVVMYDVDKILKLGGAEDYGLDPTAQQASIRPAALATDTAHVIQLVGGKVQVAPTGKMHAPRTLANAVVLPTGQVVVVGGLREARLFADQPAVMAPEIWDPTTGTFSVLAEHQIARPYHSIALLLADGRVLVGGGGLGAFPDANHPNVEILEPPYLFNDNGTSATRPLLHSVPATAANGTTIRVATSGAITSFALVRASSVTHSINNDQRRIPLTFRALTGTAYELDIPENKNVLLPGNYMLFAMNAAGTPSISKTITMGAATPQPEPVVPANLYVWRFLSDPATSGRPDARSAYYYATTTTPTPPTPPAGYVPDTSTTGFMFQAWSTGGEGRVAIDLCRSGTASHWLGRGCAGDVSLGTQFYAYAQPRPGTTKALHYLSKFGGKLVVPFSGPNKQQIDGLDAAPAEWTAWIDRGPADRLPPYYVSTSALPDRFLWRFYALTRNENNQVIRQAERQDYGYSTTGSAVTPAPPYSFQLDPSTNGAHVARAWSAAGAGRIPIYHCVSDGRNWLAAACPEAEKLSTLFYASPTAFASGAKVHHYLNKPWGGKLLIPAHAGTAVQVSGLDTSAEWTPYVNQTTEALKPVFWVHEP